MGEKAPRPVHIPSAAEAWKDIREEDAEQGLREWDAEIREAEHQTEKEDLRAQLADMEQIALKDQLTGVASRAAFVAALDLALRKSKEDEKPVAVIIADLDDFKPVNDTLGHAEGDKALVAVARALQYAVHSTDTVGRLGGDEFVILLPDTDEAAAELIAEKCRAAVSEVANPVTGRGMHVSVGAASTSAGIHRKDLLMERADKNLYADKETKAARREAQGTDPAS